jgi:hypothetical protein
MNRLVGNIPTELAKLASTLRQFALNSNKTTVTADERTYWLRMVPGCQWSF